MTSISKMIDVASTGAVALGPHVVCDGFIFGCSHRVQTHIHYDHMHGFTSSKGTQDILLSKPTWELLITEYNADLPYRSNIIPLQYNHAYILDDFLIEIIPSGHMLGCSQVAVTLQSGERLGYSSDFQWPIDRVMQVDALVLDSTYGTAQYRRAYNQQDAEAAFVDLLTSNLHHHPVIVKAHRGTLHRALDILTDLITVPFLATDRLIKEAGVYQSYGYDIPALVDCTTPEGIAIALGERHVRLWGTGDPSIIDPGPSTTIILSAFMASTTNPVLEHSNRSFRVAMSNHADFDGTLEYVKATGATYVVTDNSRGGHAVELALELRRLLGIEAVPSSNVTDLAWGAK